MRFRKTAATMAAAVAAGAAFAVLPATPAAADAAYPAPRIVLDERNQHVYLSTEGQLPYVEVFDLDGNRVGEIDGQADAGWMTLSPDGGTLYIAHAELGTISAVSTTTLQQTAVYRTGVGTGHLAFVDGRLWFSYSGGAQPEPNGIGSVDVGAQTPTVSLDPQWQWPDAAPIVLADPAEPDQLVVTTSFGDGGLGVFDVSTATPVETKQYADWNGFNDAAITPDGKDVVVASLAGISFFRLSDLQPEDKELSASDAYAVAVAPDGTLAVGSWAYWSVPEAGVSVIAPGESAPRRTFSPPVDEGGLAWSSDGSRLYAASGGASGLGDTLPVLNVYDNPERGDTTMTLTPRRKPRRGRPTPSRGRWRRPARSRPGRPCT
ncbi:lactonase family protein [Actinacidiphila yeochonensis]|uniref:hypothetical protein n=1 Tax=Actinacidiphila yeochonensis TaxID=89050 RepID=UPI0012FF41AC|nr:hypothetical protein [Actinacidiphila yeochonensis]